MARCLNPLVLNVGIRKYDFKITNEEIRRDPVLRQIAEDNKRPATILAPCGKCYNCRINRARDWTIRVMLEHTYGPSRAYPLFFLTLTYDNEHIGDNNLNYRDIQLFMKRLRKHYSGHEIKYIVCGEYGSRTGRAHWHLLFLGLPKYEPHVIRSLWINGFIKLEYVRSYSAVGYILKYALKDYKTPRIDYIKNGITPPLFRVSQGLGKLYFEQNYEEIMKTGYFSDCNGHKYRIPRYFRVLYRKIVKYDGWEFYLDNESKAIISLHRMIFDLQLPKFLYNLDYREYGNLRLLLDYARPILMRENERLYSKHFKNFKDVF